MAIVPVRRWMQAPWLMISCIDRYFDYMGMIHGNNGLATRWMVKIRYFLYIYGEGRISAKFAAKNSVWVRVFREFVHYFCSEKGMAVNLVLPLTKWLRQQKFEDDLFKLEFQLYDNLPKPDANEVEQTVFDSLTDVYPPLLDWEIDQTIMELKYSYGDDATWSEQWIKCVAATISRRHVNSQKVHKFVVQVLSAYRLRKNLSMTATRELESALKKNPELFKEICKEIKPWQDAIDWFRRKV
jgi:hypothetical protein